MLRRIAKVAGAVVLVLGVLLVGRLAFSAVDSHMNKPPRGSEAAGLEPCGERPNCVSSGAASAEQRVEPLPAPGGAEAAMARAREAIQAMPGGRVTEVAGRYLHAEFTSRIFRFRDDLELLYDPEREVFEVRSASRVGYSDMGVNRRRVEELRQRLS